MSYKGPDNLEFSWLKVILNHLATMPLLRFMGTKLPWLQLGLVSLVPALCFEAVRSWFIRYSLQSYTTKKFEVSLELQASDDEIKAMHHGMVAQTNTIEYIKSFNPFCPAFRHWRAFAAGLGAEKANENYYNYLNEDLKTCVYRKMKHINGCKLSPTK
jgi:hypothetical protein